MKYGRIILIIFYGYGLCIFAQTNRQIYKQLLAHNRSLYDMRDSTVFITFTYFNRFRNDTWDQQYCYYIRANNRQDHRYTISTRYAIHDIQNLRYTYRTQTRNNLDSPVILQPYDVDKRRPHPVFYPLDRIPKQKNGEFNREEYGKYTISRVSDTFVCKQKYKKKNRERKIYFSTDYKIMRVEEFNYNEDEPDAYVRLDAQYYPVNCFDSLNRVHQLGFYTPRVPVVPRKRTIPNKDSAGFFFILPDQVIKLDSNRFYLLDYWYMSCGPCLQMMPFMKDLHEQVDTAKITIIGVNPIDKQADMLKFLAKRNYHFIQLDTDKTYIQDLNEHPTLILIDGKRHEIMRFVGYHPKVTNKRVLNYLKRLDLLK